MNLAGKSFSFYSINFIIICFVLAFQSPYLLAQTSDDYLIQARDAAFEKKDRKTARALLIKGLQLSPDYADLSIFLGRLYVWDDMPDSARYILNGVLAKEPKNLEALEVLFDLEYWNNNPRKALEYSHRALLIDSLNEEFKIREAKAVVDTGNLRGAYTILQKILTKNPGNNKARAMAEGLKQDLRVNKVGVAYDLLTFDKVFSNWQAISLSYARQFKKGSLTARINYANRFDTEHGLQYEIDLYPRISKNMYAYVNLGFSNSKVVFPTYRSGFSLYRSLPAAFEVDLGLRYLKYTDVTMIYTGSIGKYYSNFWFNLRSYIVPNNNGASQSYTFTTRYYMGGSTNYLSLAIGSGVSPEDASRNEFIYEPVNLKSRKIDLAYQGLVFKQTIMGISAGYAFEEHLTLDQIEKVGIGFIIQQLF